MRLRELPGWASSLVGARQTWAWVPDETWAKIGEIEAREGQRFIASQNELLMVATRAGLDVLRPRGR